MVLGNCQAGSIDVKSCARRALHVRGFTLIELMITLAVAAILAMIAVPSFRHLMVTSNLSEINNSLSGDLQFARTEAVSRQVNVAVAASAGNWQNGWTVEIPAASTAGGAAATVLRVHAPIPVQYNLAVSGGTDVTYVAQGNVSDPFDANAGTCFTVSASGIQPSQFLQVMPAGMVQQSSGNTIPAGSGCPSPTP